MNQKIKILLLLNFFLINLAFSKELPTLFEIKISSDQYTNTNDGLNKAFNKLIQKLSGSRSEKFLWRIGDAQLKKIDFVSSYTTEIVDGNEFLSVSFNSDLVIPELRKLDIPLIGFNRPVILFLIKLDTGESVPIYVDGSITSNSFVSEIKQIFTEISQERGVYLELPEFDLEDQNLLRQTNILFSSSDYINEKFYNDAFLSIDLVKPSSKPLQYINKQHYDFSSMVPFQVEKSLSKISQIKTLLIGGAPVSKSLALKLVGNESKIYETFGMTETVSHFAVKNLSKGESYFSILPGISISLDKRNCLIVHAPKLNQEKLITNDVVLLLSSKKFIWIGRYDNIINSGGIKIHPEDLEKQIGTQLKSRYFISSIKDKKLGEKVVLVIEGKKTKVNFNWGEIEPIKQPKSIFFIDKFIETKSGKIKRKKTISLLNLNNS